MALFVVGRRFTGASKALVFGAAAGLGYGLQAAVTKTFVTELGGGVLALLSSWSVYVLILSAVSGFALQQSALKTGVLAPAMASSNSVTLFSSVILGIGGVRRDAVEERRRPRGVDRHRAASSRWSASRSWPAPKRHRRRPAGRQSGRARDTPKTPLASGAPG